MTCMEFLCIITKRGSGRRVVSLLEAGGVNMILSSVGYGTASDEIMNYLGLGQSDKDIVFAAAPRAAAHKFLREAIVNMDFDIPGNGIAFTVSVCSVGGTSFLNYIAGCESVREENQIMKDNENYQLIVAVANRGYTDEVMAAARAAKATGGTIIHARGTGTEQAEKFFGVSLSAEKDMVMIIVKSSVAQDVMKSVMTDAGVSTKAGALLFSLPVNEVVGLRRELEE